MINDQRMHEIARFVFEQILIDLRCVVREGSINRYAADYMSRVKLELAREGFKAKVEFGGYFKMFMRDGLVIIEARFIYLQDWGTVMGIIAHDQEKAQVVYNEVVDALLAV